MPDDICSVVCIITLLPIRPLIASSNLLHPFISTALNLYDFVYICKTGPAVSNQAYVYYLPVR